MAQIVGDFGDRKPQLRQAILLNEGLPHGVLHGRKSNFGLANFVGPPGRHERAARISWCGAEAGNRARQTPHRPHKSIGQGGINQRSNSQG